MQKISKTLQKGFTIIELIVVIAVLGVLVLLALPKFLDYTEKAKVAQVKSEIVAKEKFIDSKRVQNDDYIKDWEKVDVATMESLKKSLFNKKGLITDSNNVEFKGEYYNVPKNSELQKMKTSSVTARSLKGDFYLGQGGEVYYYDENLANKISGDGNSNNNGGNGGNSSNNGENDGSSSNNGGNDGSSDGDGNGGGNGEGDGQPPVTEPDPPVTEPEPPAIEKFTVTFKDYYGDVIEAKTVEKGQSVTPPVNPVTGLEIKKWDKDLTNIVSDLEVKPVIDGPTDKDLGYTDSDFIWIGSNKENGYFKYRGTGRSTVEIPHVIQGIPMTSYYGMFDWGSAEVSKVVSTNKNVNDMSHMFSGSKARHLDVSELDTSNVTNMSWMFASSEAVTLDLRKFDTSKVANMRSMFSNSKATVILVSNFDTSNVTNMMWMFSKSQETKLDLSSFNTSNVTVTDMEGMFSGASVIIGYARTQADADKFNSTYDKPYDLTFKVK